MFILILSGLQIKVLQQLLQQNSLAMTKGHSSLALQYSVQITKAKQQITALQVSQLFKYNIVYYFTIVI